MRKLLRITYHLGVWFLWLTLTPLIVFWVRRQKSRLAITCDRNDGIGAQIHGRLSTLAFANRFGIEYVHSNFSDVAHLRDTTELAKWNSFFDFSKTHATLSSQPTVEYVSSMRSLVLKIFLTNSRSNPTCFSIIHAHPYTDRFPKSIEKIRASVRKILGVYPIDHDARSRSDGLTVIHVRVSLENDFTFTPDRLSGREMLELKARKAREVSGGRFPIVFTPVKSPEIEAIFSSDFKIDCKSSVFDVFMNMILAHNLFIAKSSLSYSAGILNANSIHYEPMWHPRLSNWETLGKG